MAPISVDPVALDGAGTSILGLTEQLRSAMSTLDGALSGCARMTGDDPAGEVFGRAYDTSAKALVESLVDLSNGGTRVGDAVRVTASNYSKAEVASNVAGQGGPPLPQPDQTPSISAKVPPSAEGGDSRLVPPGWWLIEPLVRMVWPDGDSAKLRTAAAAWSAAGTSFLSLEMGMFGPLGTVGAQQIPEAGTIVNALTSTGNNAVLLFNQSVQISSKLQNFASKIDSVRAHIMDLLSRVMNPWTGVKELWDIITSEDDEELKKIAEDVRVILNHFQAEVAALATELAPIASAAQTIASTMGRYGEMELQHFGDAAHNVVADVVNAGASLGNAALHNPLDVVEIGAGALMMRAGAGILGPGLLADATGVGAPVGIPATLTGAGLMVAGGVLAGHGAIDLSKHAEAANAVTIMAAHTGRPGEGGDRGDGRDPYGHFAGESGYGKNAEARGIENYREDNPGRWVTTEQRKATVDGAPNSRFYDGLARLPDGTYEGIEVKSGTASRDAQQAAFDSAVSRQNPAYVTIVNEQGVVETVKVTSVRVETVK
jgi:hypothetical protein